MFAGAEPKSLYRVWEVLRLERWVRARVSEGERVTVQSTSAGDRSTAGQSLRALAS